MIFSMHLFFDQYFFDHPLLFCLKFLLVLFWHFQYPALTTDIIVGFPGETEEEFEETRKFLEEIDLYEMHVFKYSIRKGTKAADMKPQINDQIKAKRSNVLLEMSKQHQKEFETKQ